MAIFSTPGRNRHYAFQGGEPTLAGLKFFETLVGFQKRYGRERPDRFEQQFQTNGILARQRLVRYSQLQLFWWVFRLDGPEEIHDRYPATYTSRPSDCREGYLKRWRCCKTRD